MNTNTKSWQAFRHFLIGEISGLLQGLGIVVVLIGKPVGWAVAGAGWLVFMIWQFKVQPRDE